MTAPTTATIHCVKCGAEVEYTPGTGRVPKFCLAHRSTKNQARDLRRLAAREGSHAAEEARGGIDPRTPTEIAAERAAAPQLLASAMFIVKDPYAAAQLVGLHRYSREEVDALVIEAREQHQDLLKGETAATAKRIAAGVNIATLQTMIKTVGMTASTAAATVRSLAQTHEMMTGGSKQVFSGPITFEIAPKPK